MSWGQTKKINSNMDETIDELINRLNTSGATSPYRPGKQIFTSSGTFTAPFTGTYFLSGIGAGGNGTAGSDSQGGNGGNCGRFAIRIPVSLTKGQQVGVTVGTGNTVIGSYLTCTKGSANTRLTPISDTPKATRQYEGGWGLKPKTAMASLTSPLYAADGWGSPNGLGGGNYQNFLGGGGGANVPVFFQCLNGVTFAGGNGGGYDSPYVAQNGQGYGTGGGGGGGNSTYYNTVGVGAPGMAIIEW